MKLSPAQSALLHTGESAASSALMTLVVGIWQSLATGQVHWSQMAAVFGSGFVAALGLIYKSVKSSPALPQAETDTANQLASEAKSLAQQALTRIENIWPVLHDLNTRQTAQEAATPATSLATGGTIKPGQIAIVADNMREAVFPNPAANMTATYTPPQRSFNQSALMPAVTPKP